MNACSVEEHMHVDEYKHTYLWLQKPEVAIGSLQSFPMSCLEIESHSWIKNVGLANLSCHIVLGITSLCLLSAGLQGKCHACPTFMWVLGSKLSFSCLQSKHVANRIISLKPPSFYNQLIPRRLTELLWQYLSQSWKSSPYYVTPYSLGCSAILFGDLSFKKWKSGGDINIIPNMDKFCCQELTYLSSLFSRAVNLCCSSKLP